MSKLTLTEILKAIDYGTISQYCGEVSSDITNKDDIRVMMVSNNVCKAIIVIDKDTGDIGGVTITDHMNDIEYFYGDSAYSAHMYQGVVWVGNRACDHDVTLECKDDTLSKLEAIHGGQKDYDKRISIPVDLDNYHLFELMTVAHEKDITLNDYVTEIMRDIIDAEEVGNDKPVTSDDIWTID